MRFYTSFVVRCWMLEEPGRAQRSVVVLEHIQTGDHYRVASLLEAQQQMTDTCLSLQPRAGADPAEERGA